MRREEEHNVESFIHQKIEFVSWFRAFRSPPRRQAQKKFHENSNLARFQSKISGSTSAGPKTPIKSCSYNSMSPLSEDNYQAEVVGRKREKLLRIIRFGPAHWFPEGKRLNCLFKSLWLHPRPDRPENLHSKTGKVTLTIRSNFDWIPDTRESFFLEAEQWNEESCFIIKLGCEACCQSLRK